MYVLDDSMADESQIVLFTPGEIAAAEYTGYLTNRTITGQFAQAVGGAVIMIERENFNKGNAKSGTDRNRSLLG